MCDRDVERARRGAANGGPPRPLRRQQHATGGTPAAFRSESDPLALSPYASSKLSGEVDCQSFTTVYGLETVGLRFFNVFGPRQDVRSPYTGVIALFVAAMLEGNGRPSRGTACNRGFYLCGKCRPGLDPRRRCSRRRRQGLQHRQRRNHDHTPARPASQRHPRQQFAADPGPAHAGDVRHSQADSRSPARISATNPAFRSWKACAAPSNPCAGNELRSSRQMAETLVDSKCPSLVRYALDSDQIRSFMMIRVDESRPIRRDVSLRMLAERASDGCRPDNDCTGMSSLTKEGQHDRADHIYPEGFCNRAWLLSRYSAAPSSGLTGPRSVRFSGGAGKIRNIRTVSSCRCSPSTCCSCGAIAWRAER